MTKMAQDFKKFLLRGNVVDLAIAVVIGSAFGAVISSLVKDMFTPLFGVIGNKDFSTLHFTIRGSTFSYGNFLNAVIAFLMVAAAVYFFVIVPMNALIARSRKDPVPADPTTKKCPECLSEIPVGAKRCAHCTSLQPV